LGGKHIVEAPSPPGNWLRGYRRSRPTRVARCCTGEICGTSAPERPFHIAEFAPKFFVAAVPFAENTFRIAKFVVYLIEK
jgi:hypothetical protein